MEIRTRKITVTDLIAVISKQRKVTPKILA